MDNFVECENYLLFSFSFHRSPSQFVVNYRRASPAVALEIILPALLFTFAINNDFSSLMLLNMISLYIQG